MKLSDFDYSLPEELIALRPARPRTAARLLIARGDGSRRAEATRIEDATIADLPNHLREGDLLVVNDTAVIPARLDGVRRRDGSQGDGARIDATLLERLDAARWSALARPGKRLRVGDLVQFAKGGAALGAMVEAKGEGGRVTLRFDAQGAALDQGIAAVGAAPLPPYIAARRAPDEADLTDYQSIFAREPGAVAAPTASLHFDPALERALEARGVERVAATLHVGAGTFLPVTVDNLSEHKMHAEQGALSADAAARILAAKREGRRVVAVGTTALRLVESAARQPAGLGPWRGATDLFITPGFEFRIVDGLFTNFHLPKSTLLMLASAVMGREAILAIYEHAVAKRYRFFSYGDASLLLPNA